MLSVLLTTIVVLYQTIKWQQRMESNLTAINGVLDGVATTIQSIIMDQNTEIKNTQLSAIEDLDRQLTVLQNSLASKIDAQKLSVQNKLQTLAGKILNIEKNLDKIDLYFANL